jgi:hypothetical protein
MIVQTLLQNKFKNVDYNHHSKFFIEIILIVKYTKIT